MNEKQAVTIDKIIAVESLINQIKLIQEYCFEEIVVLRKRADEVARDEIVNLIGIEKSGTLSLIGRGQVPIRLRVSDITSIEQSWEDSGFYRININLIDGCITLLFRITENMIVR